MVYAWADVGWAMCHPAVGFDGTPLQLPLPIFCHFIDNSAEYT